MSNHFFWLTKDQFSKIRPHLPTDTRGVARVDDRRVISGIIHVLKSGGPPAQVLIDSTAVRAHRSAAGGKGGRKIRRSGARAADARRKSTR
jgi:transposase